MRRILLALVPLTCVAGLPAQLRRAVAEAEFVVVARQVGVAARIDERTELRHFAVMQTLRGAVPPRFRVAARIDAGPAVAPPSLLCLNLDRDAAVDPSDPEPLLRTTRSATRSPPIDDSAGARSTIELVQALVASEDGQAPRRTASELVRIVLYGAGPARVEAVESLRERATLRSSISPVGREGLLLRAVGETGDPDFAVALACLCADAGQPGVVEALCMGLQTNDAPTAAIAVGRVASRLHGERAVEVLQPFLRQAQGPVRERILLAIGATATDAALDLLQSQSQRGAPPDAIDAALRAHGSAQAIDAIGGRRPRDPAGRPADADRRG